MEIKEFINNQKEKLNIDIIGFTDGKPSDFLKDRLETRIREEKITEFEDKDIEIKLDVGKSFPDYKTIIVVGESYLNTYREDVTFNKGLLSKSSWGEDYHYVLKRKMDSLIEVLKNKYGGEYKAFVDTGPLVDRNLAYSSGLGYYGKNCSIINKELGSFIFIGYIITDLYIDLDNKRELESECGECKLCLKYCPTQALEEPFKLNPKKCISYLTQTKEKIPYELREKMGAKIYGCDTCQDICPKNKNVKIKNKREFIPVKTKGYMDLDEILTMSNKEFKEKYGDMSGSWRGKNILKRNAIVALGNKFDKNYIDLLLKELRGESEMLKEYAIWSIIKIDPIKGREILDKEFKNKKLGEVLKEEYKSVKNYFGI